MFSAHSDGYRARRRKMVDKLITMGISNELVLKAMEAVPRHFFIAEALRSHAYDDSSLPIGSGQTISQPYIVARMTELLLAAERPPDKVLEIGTGCGYQTAVLTAVGIKNIYSLERMSGLRELAKDNLRRARLITARLLAADGCLGLPAVAPFDGIIVTAAAKEVPSDFLQQLNVGGRLVLPLIKQQRQFLWTIDKYANGYRETCIQEVKFVLLQSGKE